MTTNYYLSNTDSDLTGGTLFNKILALDVVAPTEYSSNLGNGQTATSFGYTPASVPSTFGVTGDYAITVVVSTGSTDIFMSIAVARVNSSGTQQAISSFSAEQQATAGTHTFSGGVLNAVNLGTWASGDRLRVSYRARNAAAHATRSYGVTVGSTDALVVAPWTIIATVTGTGSPTDVRDTASGAADVLKTATGTPTDQRDTASGAADVLKTATGTPTDVRDAAAGVATASSAATSSSGTPTDVRDTSSGATRVTSAWSAPDSATTDAGGVSSSGALTDVRDTSSGAAVFTVASSGTPTDVRDTASGAAVFTVTSSGSPTDVRDTASGVAAFGVTLTASGSPTDQRDTASGAVTATAVTEAVGPSLGSSDPLYRSAQHHLALTDGGRILMVHGLHGQGVRLVYSDDGGATWSTLTRGASTVGELLTGTGSGDWPSSIVVSGDVAYAVWSRNSVNGNVGFARLSDIDNVLGPNIGATQTLETGIGRLPDVAAITGGVVFSWWEETTAATTYNNVAGVITNLTVDNPTVTETVIVSASGTGRYGTLVSDGAGGVAFAHRGASGNIRLHFRNSGTGAWTQAAVAGPVIVNSVPAATYAGSRWHVAYNSNITASTEAVSVQSWNADGSSTTADLTLTGYFQPSLATDGTTVYLIARRLSDDRIVSRSWTSGGGWSTTDVVQMATQGAGVHTYPNAERSLRGGLLRFAVRGPGTTGSQSRIYYVSGVAVVGPPAATGSPTDQRDTASGAATATAAPVSSSGALTDQRDTASGVATAAAPGVSATGAATDTRDTAAGVAVFSVPATGTPTDQRDTAAGVGSVSVTSSGAVTDTRDTAQGTSGAIFTAVGAVTDQRDTATGASVIRVSATGSPTDQRDTSTGSATFTVSAFGSPTDTRDTSSGSATFTVTSSGAVTDRRDTAQGTSGDTKTGAGAPTDQRDTTSGAAASTPPAVSASGAVTDTRDSTVGQVTFTVTATGAVTDTRDAATGSATFTTASAAGSGTPTDSRDTATGSATFVPTSTATGTPSDQRDTAFGAVVVRISASGAVTDQRDTVYATTLPLAADYDIAATYRERRFAVTYREDKFAETYREREFAPTFRQGT